MITDWTRYNNALCDRRVLELDAKIDQLYTELKDAGVFSKDEVRKRLIETMLERKRLWIEISGSQEDPYIIDFYTNQRYYTSGKVERIR